MHVPLIQMRNLVILSEFSHVTQLTIPELKEHLILSHNYIWMIRIAIGLPDLWGIADLHCRKVKSTKWLKHKLRATLGRQ